MKALLSNMLQIITTVLAIGAIGAAAAHIQLQFLIDGRRVKEETGHPGWKIWGSWLAPMEFYKESAKIIWRIRRVGMATVIVAAGCIVLVAIIAEALGIRFE